MDMTGLSDSHLRRTLVEYKNKLEAAEVAHAALDVIYLALKVELALRLRMQREAEGPPVIVRTAGPRALWVLQENGGFTEHRW
jgi:hypothetical protein